MIAPTDLGRFLDPANPETQVLYADQVWRPVATGSGTVTSVDMTAPVEFSVGGVPITTAGTIALAWVSQLQNLFFASPDGAPGVPSFRAIVPADLPAGTGTVTSVDVAVPVELSSTGGPITTAGTITLAWQSQTQHQVFAAPSGSNGTPSFRLLVAGDIPALAYVTSVDFAAPPEFSVSGNPITGAGTITLAWVSEAANKVLAGPTGGGSATPAFRLLVAADIPALAYVTSVGLTGVTGIISVSGSPITSSGTFALSLDAQTAHTFLAGPTSAGPSVPTFRALVASDLGSGTANASKYLAGDLTWQTTPTNVGTVTSVDVSGITSFITTSGGPVTSSGTIALALATQTANKIFAGPTSGGAAVPTFRSVVTADLGSGTASSSNFLRGDLTWATPTGTAVGFLTGLDQNLPAASTFNMYYATDTQEWYISDGTNIRNARTGQSVKCTCSAFGGSFASTVYLGSSAAANVGPIMSNPYTLVVQIFVNSLPGTRGDVIIGYGVGGVTRGWYLQTSQTSSNKLALFMKGINSDVAVQLNLTLTTGIHVIALKYDGSNITYCMDGGSTATAATSGTFTAPDSTCASRIGGFFNSQSFPLLCADFAYALGIASAVSNSDLQTLSNAGSTYRPGITGATYDWFFHASFIMLGGWGSSFYGPLAKGTICNENSGMFCVGNYVTVKAR